MVEVLKILGAIFYVFCVLLLIVLILLQRGKGEGLAAALGGGSADSLFGPGTKNPLRKVTAVVGALFLVGAVLLFRAYVPSGATQKVQGFTIEPRSAPPPFDDANGLGGADSTGGGGN